MLVLQRDPLYVVGRGSFVDEMMGARAPKPRHEFAEPWPRVTHEWLLAAAPELILDAAEPAAARREHWARWPSLPAVSEGAS